MICVIADLHVHTSTSIQKEYITEEDNIMRKIKVIVKRPDEEVGHMTYISDRLPDLQYIVDGYIETVTLSSDLVVICNEEGRLQGLPHNCKVCGIDFVGTVIVAGVEEDSFGDVPIDLQEWLDYVTDQRQGGKI